MSEKSASTDKERQLEISKVLFGTIVGYSILLVFIVIFLFIIPFIIFSVL